MAKATRDIYIESSLPRANQTQMGLQLHPACRDQTVVLSPQELKYADPLAWKLWDKPSKGGKLPDGTVEFIGGQLQVDGTYEAEKLDRGMIYEVFFHVTIEEREVESAVKLTLVLPNGITNEDTIQLKLSPGEWKALGVGRFINLFTYGNIKFSFSGASGDTWKDMLLIRVVITPSINN